MALTEAGAAVIGSAIAAGGQLASQGVGAIRNQKKWEKRQAYLEEQQKRAETRQFDYNKQLQDYAYQKNLEQWQRENAYNTPASQMQRFAAAGLNPNLVYGDSGAALAANSPQMSLDPVGTGQSNVAPYSTEAFGTNFDYLGALQYALQAKMTDAQVANINADTLGKLNDVDWYDVSKELRLTELAKGIENTIADTQNKSADTDLKGAQQENVETDTAGKKIANEIADATKETQIADAAQTLQNKQREGWNLEKMGKLITAQTRKTNLDGDLVKVQKRIAELDEKIKKVDADNAEYLMELRKERENCALRMMHKQERLLAKDLQYYDKKTLAQLTLSAAEAFNRQSFGDLAVSEKNYQDFKNKMNEILLDPTKATDAATYFEALILKNMNDTQLMDVVKFLSDKFEDADFGKGSDSSEKKNDSPVVSEPSSHTSASDLFGIARRYWYDWQERNPNATPEQRQQYLDWLGKKFAD